MIGRLTLTLLAAAASTPPGELAPIHGPYHPAIDPANFVRTVDNRYLPYAPGMRIRFKGVRGEAMDKAVDELLAEREAQPKPAEKPAQKPADKPAGKP